MLIAITPGDPDGIGPEVVFKALSGRPSGVPRSARLLCIGAPEPFQKLGAVLREVSVSDLRTGLPRSRPGELLFLTPPKPPMPHGRRRSGVPFSLPGFQCGWAIERATELAVSGVADAIVTGPISKARLRAGGYAFPGHTEMLASLCRKKQVTMMLANDQLRISLVTTHLPLKAVSSAITPGEIARAVRHTVDGLRNWWGISSPRIAICALNPHAGEEGLLGTEELKVITPTIKKLKKQYGRRATLEGPVSADTLFARNSAFSRNQRYDAVVCMYHDQGLIPVKLLDFSHTVNVSLGLPIIRTSVDHGVAFDIAGQGRADPSSFTAALQLACKLVQSRKEKK